MEPMAVAVHAIRRVKPEATDKIAICGLGTIGLFTAMFLQEMGCRDVYVAGNKDFQKNMAMQMGIAEDHFCDVRYAEFPEWLMEQTNRADVDVFFDCVGKNEVFAQGVASLAAKGKLAMVGNPATDMGLEKTLYWKILRKQLQLVGTWNSSFTHEKEDDWHFVLNALEQQRIHPEYVITHHMSEDTFIHGFEIMRDKKEDYVKIMMLCD